MLKKFVLITILLIAAYVLLIQGRFWFRVYQGKKHPTAQSQGSKKEIAQQVYSFSFSKYNATGEKEIEIEGDSADIMSQDVQLLNVIAKAYAEETPVTITANKGSFDRKTSNVTLKENVVATTETGVRLLTDTLGIQTTQKKMHTDDVAKVKKDNISVEGTGAESDSQLQKVFFKKKVTVVVQNPDSETKTPTVITSDGPLEIDYKRNIAHFSKNVQAVDERGTLISDYLDVYYNKTTRRVSKMVARGNVAVESKEGNKTYSDSAVYLADEGRVVLGGDVEAEYVNPEETVGDKKHKTSIDSLLL